MNIGYHYTTLENWNLIQHTGLIPQKLYKETNGIIKDHRILRVYFPDKNFKCTWLFENIQNIKGHLGSLLFQLIEKSNFEICVLEVRYKNSEMVKSPLGFDKLNITHNGDLGNWKYHNEAPSVLLRKRIPIKRIKLLRTYDFLKFAEI